jgi:hypothetical protein
VKLLMVLFLWTLFACTAGAAGDVGDVTCWNTDNVCTGSLACQTDDNCTVGEKKPSGQNAVGLETEIQNKTMKKIKTRYSR